MIRSLVCLSSVALTALGLALPARAQFSQFPGPSIFENAVLSLGFVPDPAVLRGISGGEQPAREVADRVETPTGPCTGFVDRQPDHLLTLTEFFDYLDVQVYSPEDTTLVVRGPGGTWCNDDIVERNPGIAGQWLPGRYEIWVGSYEQHAYHPYIIRLSQVR